MRKRRNAERSKRRNENARIGRLCDWFESNARRLPWRIRRSGYRALVAELMLQQTQVSRVIDRYATFMRKFPNVQSLARADEHDLLHVWQGLGYYRRARHLHSAAKLIVSDFGGRVPRTVEDLMKLPGVGRYTAGAIASIVFGQAEPIVDGNVQRVLARWLAKRDLSEDSMVRWTWDAASELVKQAAKPGQFNEALMELGSLVCTPRAPKCSECPVARMCETRRLGLQDQIPAPKSRAKVQVVHHHAVIITRNGKALMEKRDGAGMWAGLWQTPTIENNRPMTMVEIKTALPINVINLTACGSFAHHTSHRAIQFHVFRAHSRSRAGQWRTNDEIAQLPMSNAQKRVMKHGDSTSALSRKRRRIMPTSA